MMTFKRVALTLAAAVIALCSTTAVAVHAFSGYNSSSDPLISKSYLEKYVSERLVNVGGSVTESAVQQIKDQLSAELAAGLRDEIKASVTEQVKTELRAELTQSIKEELKTSLYADLKKELSDLLLSESPSQVDADLSFEIVCLQPGQKLIGTGFLELIVRSGGANVIAATDGLCDFTLGRDIGAGVSVSMNHYVIIPRDDGRGLDITKADTYIMVRGDYEIR